MAAGFMPSADDDAELAYRHCALCEEVISEGARFYQRNGWQLLAHMACVLANLDAWDALPDIKH